jgi:MYXO-CTERM domain-containing protein
VAWFAAGSPTRAQLSADFEQEIRAFEETDRTSPPPPASIVFAGSSSIRLWTSLGADFAGWPVLNRGFGGSHYRHLGELRERVILKYQPQAVVLYSGDNDLADGWAVESVNGYMTNLVTAIRRELPAAHIAVLAIKPSPARWWAVEFQRQFNQAARQFCAGGINLHFVDVASALLDQTGQPRPELFSPDRKHLNAAGYANWRDHLTREFEQWRLPRKQPPPPVPGIFLALAAVALIALVRIRHRRRRSISQPS